MECPKCRGDRLIKNKRNYYGKQRFKYKTCDRQFIENSQYQPISQATKNLIVRVASGQENRLLLERMPLAGIASVIPFCIKYVTLNFNE